LLVPLLLVLALYSRRQNMPTLINATSDAASRINQDFKKGALTFDASRGALYKAETQQEFLFTNKDQLVRFDGRVGQFNKWDGQRKEFLPINGLEPGEQVDRSRKLSPKDIIAPKTWGEVAEDAAFLTAQSVATGAVLGVVGGAVAATAEHVPSVGLPETVIPSLQAAEGSGAVIADAVSSNNGVVETAAGLTMGQVGRAVGVTVLEGQLGHPIDAEGMFAHVALAQHGPFNPGDLRPPDPWFPPIVPPPPPPGLGRRMQETANEAAFGITGGAIGGALGAAAGGPPGMLLGNAAGAVVGVAVGKLWNEIF
jgi:hypothetical protein